MASTSVFADKEGDTQEGDSMVPSHTDSRGRDGARSQAPGLTQLRKHEWRQADKRSPASVEMLRLPVVSYVVPVYVGSA